MEVNISIPYCPFDYQKDIHLSPVRFKLIVGGRRVGKSKLAMQELIRHCLTTPNAMAWWIAPTYKDAKEIGFEEFVSIQKVLEPALQSVHHTSLHVKFINGSQIYFKGSDNVDSLRGRGLTFCVIDEAAFCYEDAWKKCIRPALSDKRGRAILISTPNGRNWFYNQFKYATYKSNNTWFAWHWPTSSNPLISTEDLQEARMELSDVDFRQEYLAEFVTKAGMVYDEFNEANIIEDFIPDRSRHDIYLGLDFGFASATAICFMAVDRATNKIYQFDELFLTRRDIGQVAFAIQNKLIKWKCGKPEAIYTDPAGNAEELTSGLSPVDFLRKEGYQVLNKGTRIMPGLSQVRAYIRNAQGERRYFVDKRCVQTIKSFYGYTYRLVKDLPTEEPEKDNIHDHMCDAVRYFFVNKFDTSKYVGSQLTNPIYSTLERGRAIMKRCAHCKQQFFSRTARNEPPFLCSKCETEGY
jgi:PBSX family phage terminase large subunit